MARRKREEIETELDRLQTKLETEKAFFDNLSDSEVLNASGVSARKAVTKTRSRIQALEWVLNKE